MNQPLKTFKQEFQNLLLNFLWRQWSALGAAGQAGGEDAWIIDPEALLLFTCTLGRHEPRLFDEALDWLRENGRFMNVARLKRILQMEKFAGEQVLTAVAGVLAKGTEATKWKLLANSVDPSAASEMFFFASDGKPQPALGEPEPHFARCGFRRGPLRQRGYSQKFRPSQPANLTLQLRALFGINVRCESVLYLLTHEAAHPSRIARESYCFERAVQGTLVDMSQSGVVGLRSQGRQKHYWLKPEPWAALLNRPQVFPHWVTWPPLFSALERIWLKINDPRLEALDPLLQSSELRQLMAEVRPGIERAGFDRRLSDNREYLGEKYLPVFLADVIKLLA
ncbi:MAG TPA: hypothetical protein VH619_14165 [Verrucomicrobiae bacterium]|jgi:hypothetical protein|nr:hypothetical protein [Verrucomicrobiae bacterium]